MSEIIEAWKEAFRPQAKLRVSNWGKRLSIPNSARSSKFDPVQTPHLIEPMDFWQDRRINEMVLLMPTGAGKTTFFDVTIPYSACEDPGSILQLLQSKADADSYFDERMEPILLGVDEIRRLVDGLPRNKRRKGEWVLPHLTYYCKPANRTELQRKSVRYVMLDEAWTIEHGLIEEARARTHNRWNSRVCIVSQGGFDQVAHNRDLVTSELSAAWERTDKREYSLRCLQCGEVAQWRLANLKWDEGSEREDGTIDELALEQSTRYECPHCSEAYRDEPLIRRELSKSSLYVPTNLQAPYRYKGWHAPCIAMLHESWAGIAAQWLAASRAWKQGDQAPRRIFIQKRLAENWKVADEVPVVAIAIGDYSLADYAGGELWSGEAFRAMTIDRQQDHWWAVVRSWKQDGSSRLLWCGRLNTIEEVRALQQTMRVPDRLTFQDCGHAPDAVYTDCANYGWIAFRGDQQEGFFHTIKGKPKAELRAYSRPQPVQSQSGKVVHRIHFSNERVKDILAFLRSGRGAAFEVGGDTPSFYHAQMNSEVKRLRVSRVTKVQSERWEQIGKKPNHIWDCEVQQVVVALILGVLTDGHHQPTEPAEEATDS